MSMPEISRRYETSSIDTVKSMSGLEFLAAIRDGRLPGPPIARLLGFDLVEVEDGRAVFAGTP